MGPTYPQAYGTSRLETHSRPELTALGIRPETSADFLPGTLVTQHVGGGSRPHARCGTVIEAHATHVSIFWAQWVPDPGPDADVLAGVAQLTRAIQSLGHTIEAAGTTMGALVASWPVSKRRSGERRRRPVVR